MPNPTLRERYRSAEQRLREILFGDSTSTPGRLKGEEPRFRASRELGRMRSAFDEALAERAQERSLDEDLRDAAADARDDAREGESGKSPPR